MSEQKKYVIDEQVWKTFVHTYTISDMQQKQYKQFIDLLLQENKKYNLTAITSIKDIILDHLYDSLAPSKIDQMEKYRSIGDVGTGGGFPGIPLAILYPDKKIHLIETNNKKIAFLELVCEKLGLENVVMHNLDWRTFLRSKDLEIDLFVSRASVAVEELLRIYKPSSFYKTSTLMYWASQHWKLDSKDGEAYLKESKTYFVGTKKRILALFRP
jgi:16S rRNA (guanine(527)-N(7))-methyltransferase RsmG